MELANSEYSGHSGSEFEPSFWQRLVAGVKNFGRSVVNGAKEFWCWLSMGCRDIKVALEAKLAERKAGKGAKTKPEIDVRTKVKVKPYYDMPDRVIRREAAARAEGKRAEAARKEQRETVAQEGMRDEEMREVVGQESVRVEQVREEEQEGATRSGADEMIAPPQSVEELMAIIRDMPQAALGGRRERKMLLNTLRFPQMRVADVMVPQEKIVYVHDDEVLGPLVLDRLYRSGFQHFPVLNYDRRIIGMIHTTAFNSLEIKETSRVIEILDSKVYYVRDDYTLEQALAAFVRTNAYLFLVVDRHERIVGMLTHEQIIGYLLGEVPEDNFTQDSKRAAVAKR